MLIIASRKKNYQHKIFFGQNIRLKSHTKSFTFPFDKNLVLIQKWSSFSHNIFVNTCTSIRYILAICFHLYEYSLPTLLIPKIPFEKMHSTSSDIFVRYRWKEKLSMNKSKMRISRGGWKATLTYFIMIGQLRTGVIPIHVITLML